MRQQSATKAEDLASAVVGRARTGPPAAARSRPRPAAERRVDTGVATELKIACLENQNGNPGISY